MKVFELSKNSSVFCWPVPRLTLDAKKAAGEFIIGFKSCAEEWPFVYQNDMHSNQPLGAYFFLPLASVAQTSPIIFSLSFGELSAINNVNAVSAGGVILEISKIFVCRKNQIKE